MTTYVVYLEWHGKHQHDINALVRRPYGQTSTVGCSHDACFITEIARQGPANTAYIQEALARTHYHHWAGLLLTAEATPADLPALGLLNTTNTAPLTYALPQQ